MKRDRVIQHSLKRLVDNLKWIELPREVKSQIGMEGNLTLCNKLNALTHMKRCDPKAREEVIISHIARSLSILEQLLPLIVGCSVQFKQEYVTSAPFVKYVIDMLEVHHTLLSKELLMKALSFVNAVASTDYIGITMKLLQSLSTMPETQDVCLNHCNDVLKLLHNTPESIISQELCDISMEALFKTVVAGIDTSMVETSLSLLYLLLHHFPDYDRLQEVTKLYMREVKHHIFCLDPSILINVLQFIYRCKYTDDELYTTAMESLLYKYEHMTFNEKSTLLLMLPYLKHLCLLKTPNISRNAYSEECQMLNSTLRREFENLVMSMSPNDMVTHCLAISLMFKQSKVVRKLLLKSITPAFLESLDSHGFLKLLSCCNTLHIDSSYIEVSRMLSKAVHAKLTGSNGADLVLAFKSISQITARRHRKYLIPLVMEALEANSQKGESLIECLHLYVALNMQRIDGTVLEHGISMLFPHMQKIENNNEYVMESTGRPDLDTHNFKTLGDDGISIATTAIESPENGRIDVSGKHNRKRVYDILYIPRSDNVASEIPLKGLCKLLECLTKMESPLERLIPLFCLLQTSILMRIKYSSSVGIGTLAGILRSMTECRIVQGELATVILDRIYNYPELLEDAESAAHVLKFVEFTNHMDYQSKLSKPLFEYCLRKPTAELLEVLEYQRYKRPDFYSAYTDMMDPSPPKMPDGPDGIVNDSPLIQNNYGSILSTVRISRPSGGKRQQILSQWLLDQPDGQGFEEYYRIGNLVVDFFNPKSSTAVLILRNQDHYTYNKGFHLKNRMWLTYSMLRLQGISVIMVPEAVLVGKVSTRLT
ncbi:hypothetical protein BgAZ_108130 [Babesia gibsoni]|uniref:Uncharacterized protein n=1 Tax=Babesia gibsoni TaxID=33632 RepID=A0AAD8PGT7_BABGI|nr:hypothetical protein BgAZ_108130 [Babesia gibsoni]